MGARKPNRLISEKSPYLLQHAYNPVEWHPWGEEAFAEAEREDRPVFLSIGYSTCHWCHVMEHESFEDPEVARLMNETFVSIKVDREERPDLDHVYMMVCQMLTGSGGWPLTIIMTPDKKPFFAATYLPKESRFGRTGMTELMPRIKAVWENRRDEVLKSADQIIAALRSTEAGAAGGAPEGALLERGFRELSGRYDPAYGGFSQAPKFPTPHNFFFLLRYWKRTGDAAALEMVEKTLQAMRLGGLYDQVGYGYHRYSTDKEWRVPHFEKMLYDQAMLTVAYLEAYQAAGNEIYGRTAREILTYALRDMQDPDGAFYSAEDADSEGAEGKYYVWSEKEIRETLDEDTADLMIRLFNIKKEGNFREEATGEKTGTNIPHLSHPLDVWASELGVPRGALEERIGASRERLLHSREKRVRPHRDDKILTDWNGLMIAALARAARVLETPAYATAAVRAKDFILGRMRTPEGRLLHRYREGEAGIRAHLDDYAFLIWGLLELYEATYDAGHLKAALELNEDMIRHYWDRERGGFFFTADDAEALIVRRKEVYDGAVPSGNSVAMLNLLRLARVTGRSDLDEMAAAVGRAFSAQIAQMPSGYTQFLVAVDFGLGPAYEVVVVGRAEGEDTTRMLRALGTSFLPRTVTLFRPSGQGSPPIAGIAPFTQGHKSMGEKATAYVCSGNTCQAPTTDVGEMMRLME